MSRADAAERRREQILTAACEVIGDRGLQSLRLSDVAQRAGVSSGTIHYYFDTKRDVVNAAFQLNYERSLQSRHDMLASSQTDPRTTLRTLVSSYLPVGEAATRAWRVWAELWSEGMRDDGLQELNARLYGQWRNLVRDLIVAGQHAGTIIDGDAGGFADVAVALIDGMSIQHLMNSPAMPLETMHARVDGYLDSISAA
ncbi:TetR/AcrR family transcriptional regulator [Gordonia neofelifaecis]|uniref:TetR family transcriptional regulator n=1 Tax=Gordonia neofelifaecis NRRL B-59395 TaxID=644548 RepID=F1YJ17_9ACTN|nr:TetR/AcrR family transcriptional regulator [Gordonia neofelifaecis]EGD55475.1 TetR family transcriptional regulator [Gordonia neofelifaecis NRRL B-59395]